MTIYGYARVSTNDQNLSRQIDALKSAGVKEKNIFREYKSGKNFSRPEFLRLMEKLEAGDKVVVLKLDRMSRSTKDLLSLVEEFHARSVEFVSLQDAIDTSTAQGQFFFTIIAAFSELERSLIVERTNEGIAAARSRGVRLGRPSVACEKIEAVEKLRKEKGYTLKEACEKIGIAKATYYNYLNRSH